MFSWILLLLVLAIFVVLGLWILGRFGAGGPAMDGPERPADIRAHNRAALERGDLRDLRFDVVRHGYRQDQVDEMLDALEQRLRGSVSDSKSFGAAGAAALGPARGASAAAGGLGK